MRTQPFWLDTATPLVGSHEPLPSRADAVVIGAGFSGLSAARSLARDGVDVVVLEQGTLLQGASGSNGGHCNTGVAHDFASLIKQVGVEQAVAWQHSFNDAVDYVEQVIQQEQIDCDFKRTGKLKLASKASHMAGLTATAEALRTHAGSAIRVLHKDELSQEVRSAAFHGGLLDTTGAQMHMGKFGMGLAKAAMRRDARIHEHTQLSAMQRLGEHAYQLTTTRGDIRAERVLLATGCSREGPLRWFQRRIVPVGSSIIVTEPLAPELSQSLLPHDRTYVTTQNIGNYFRLTADQRLLFGGRARFSANQSGHDARSANLLQRKLRQLFPELAATRIDYAWSALVDMTTDRMPRAGVREGLYYTLGYSGHGTQMSVLMGDIMAQLMQGRDRHNPWVRDHWKAVPCYRGKPWFLPAVGLYYRTRDLIS